MNPEELTLVRDTIRNALVTYEPTNLINALGDLGFFELVTEEPVAVWSTLFETQGRECVASPALDLVVLDALGLGANAAVVYPSVAGGSPTSATAEGTGGNGIAVDGFLLSGERRVERLVLGVLDADEGVRVALAPADAPGLKRHPVRGQDPELGLVLLSGTLEGGDLEPVDGDWNLATTRARRAIAQEVTGVSQALLSTAIEHVTTRQQFGAPIGLFQAVKHRLADVHVAIALAQSTLDVAWHSDDPVVATLAKLVAGQAATTAIRHGQQVTGAMGFTWEMGLHRYVRRALVLDSLLGSSAVLRNELGTRFVENGASPRLVDIATG